MPLSSDRMEIRMKGLFYGALNGENSGSFCGGISLTPVRSFGFSIREHVALSCQHKQNAESGRKVKIRLFGSFNSVVYNAREDVETTDD